MLGSSVLLMILQCIFGVLLARTHNSCQTLGQNLTVVLRAQDFRVAVTFLKSARDMFGHVQKEILTKCFSRPLGLGRKDA